MVAFLKVPGILMRFYIIKMAGWNNPVPIGQRMAITIGIDWDGLGDGRKKV